ncbi:hypothetical protein Tco_0885462 [Tanacetum coccineum]
MTVLPSWENVVVGKWQVGKGWIKAETSERNIGVGELNLVIILFLATVLVSDWWWQEAVVVVAVDVEEDKRVFKSFNEENEA